MIQSKRCNRCDHHKPVEEFYAARERKDGRATICIACCKRAYQKKPSFHEDAKHTKNWHPIISRHW